MPDRAEGGRAACSRSPPQGGRSGARGQPQPISPLEGEMPDRAGGRAACSRSPLKGEIGSERPAPANLPLRGDAPLTGQRGVEPLALDLPSRGDREREASPSNLPLREMPDRAEGVEPLLSISPQGEIGSERPAPANLPLRGDARQGRGGRAAALDLPQGGDREREASSPLSQSPLEGEMPDRAEGVEPLALDLPLKGRSGARGQPQPISP